jgi:hypothetical protein
MNSSLFYAFVSEPAEFISYIHSLFLQYSIALIFSPYNNIGIENL